MEPLATRRTPTPTAFLPVPHSLVHIILAASLLTTVSASASLDLDRCCMLSARSQFATLQKLPWDACGVNKTSSSINPQVTTTLGWCEKNCPGFQLSTFDQWSGLLTTF